MQGAIHCIRPQKPAARHFQTFARTLPSLWTYRARLAQAAKLPIQTSNDTDHRESTLKSARFGTKFLRWAATGKDGAEQTDTMDGWGPDYRDENLKFEDFGNDAEEFLRITARSVQVGSDLNWMDLFRRMQRDYGKLGSWRFFELLEETQRVNLLLDPRSDDVRDEIVAASVIDDARLARVVEGARSEKLRGHLWPDLWATVLYSLLKREEYTRAFLWHIRLAHEFPPDAEVFGSMLSVFVVNRSHGMQQCLSAIYILNKKKTHYDHIVPALWEAGLSSLARTWRATLTFYGDYPSNKPPQRSRHFLEFVKNYYPRINLTEQEQKILDPLARKETETSLFSSPTETSPKSQFLSSVLTRDDILAKWFASSFISPQLAISFAHRLGLKHLGPLSLQSLALRERDAESFAYRVLQLEKLGISLSDSLYTKALISLAKTGADQQLRALALCDVHPEEFGNAQSRKRLREAAVKEGDLGRQALIDVVESFASRDLLAHRLNDAMTRNLQWIRSRKALVVLDRMNALKVRMTEPNADKLLSNVFWKLGEHTSSLWGEEQFTKKDTRLDKAIRVTRHVVSQKLPVPVYRWKTILNVLGRCGRFEELEQICLEICQYYRPAEMGILPVHHLDNPRLKQESLELRSELEMGRLKARPEREADGQPRLRTETEVGVGVRSDAAEPTSFGVQDPAFKKTLKQPNSFEDMILLRRLDSPPQSQSEEWDLPMQETITTSPKPNEDPSNIRGGLEQPRGQQSPTFIPSDLPFTHRQHPVQLIFDVPFQRSVIRWTYDQALAGNLGRQAGSNRAKFDVASGVLLLRLLRERGVYIDLRSLRKALTLRMAVAKIPQRRKSRSRDDLEADPQQIKALVDAAWGSVLLPDNSQLEKDIEKARLKLWKRYDRNYFHCDPESLPDTNNNSHIGIRGSTRPRHVSSSTF